MSRLFINCFEKGAATAIYPERPLFSLDTLEITIFLKTCRKPDLEQTAELLYSHSTVLGGLLVMSYTTRLMPGTSATMRLEILPSTS